MSLAHTESESNHESQSSKGAYGLTQLMPATAERLGVDYTTIDGNIEGAAKYLAELLEETNNNLPMALNRYNCGPKGVKKAVERADSDDYFVYRYFFKGDEARNFPLKVLSALPYFGKQYNYEEGKIKDLSLNSFVNLFNEEETEKEYAQLDTENNYD